MRFRVPAKYRIALRIGIGVQTPSRCGTPTLKCRTLEAREAQPKTEQTSERRADRDALLCFVGANVREPVAV